MTVDRILPKTMYIHDPEKLIFEKGRGKKFYADNFSADVFHKNLKGWKQVPLRSKNITYSNIISKSVIKSRLKNMQQITIKGSLYNIIKGEFYALDFINFNLSENSWYEKQVRPYIEYDNSLWFLKKSNFITYGGYDVFPLISNPRTFKKSLLASIDNSNYSRKYHSNEFTLQKGVENLELASDGRKRDFRIYGLVTNKYGKIRTYLYTTFLIRKTTQEYSRNSISRENQLTNTTFNSSSSRDYRNLTELSNSSLLPDHFSVIVKACKNIYSKIRKILSDPDEVAYNIIGFDFIFDSNKNPWLLEINYSPALYNDHYRIEYNHRGLEYELFNQTFFDLTLNYLAGDPLPKSKGKWIEL